LRLRASYESCESKPEPKGPSVASASGTRDRELRRELGLREAVTLGVGGTVGGGIFVLVGEAAGLAGPAALAAFVLAFTASLLIALPYAELACRLPLAGGGYAFARQVLGRHWGFLMGWGYAGAYVFVSGYVTVGFGGYLQAVTGLPAAAGAIALVAGCTVLNLLGVKLSGRAQAVVVLVAMGGLAALVLWGLPAVRLGRLVPFAPNGAQGVFQATLVAFLSLGGFDMVAAAGEEVRQPERNLPRAILITLAGVVGLYLLIALVALGSVPASRLGASPAPLAEAASAFGGDAARRLIVCCALLTTAATANAVLVVTSRVVFAMARDKLLPSRLAAVHPATGTPVPAVLACGLLLAVVAALGTVRFAAAAGGFLYVLHFVPPLIALVLLRRRPGGGRPAFTVPAPRVLLPLAFAATAALVVASGRTGLVAGGAWLLAGLAVHALWNRRGDGAERR
jgi:basic amino acid/polyamine antiporter, APA family